MKKKKRKNLRKKKYLVILAAMILLFIFTLGVLVYAYSQQNNIDSLHSHSFSEQIDDVEVTSEAQTNASETKSSGFTFSDLKTTEFWFASGAGGWSTTMMIEEDGSFSGVYHDSDMGSSGENYPNGTIYYCAFSGQLSEPVQVDRYSYQTSIENIAYENPEDTEEIKNDTRYIYSNAYGLDDPKDIMIYLPGMPTKDLPEGYLSWVRSDLYINYDSAEMVEELPFYGFYNVNAQQGFSSYKKRR